MHETLPAGAAIAILSDPSTERQELEDTADAALEETVPSPVTMEDLECVISTAKLLPAGIEVNALGPSYRRMLVTEGIRRQRLELAI
jgi:hypothetical protein